MFESLLQLLRNGLGEDSKTYLFLESLLNNFGEGNFLLITVVISLLILGYLFYQLFRGRFIRFRDDREYRDKSVNNYSEYIDREITLISIYILLSVFAIGLFFVKGLGIDLLGSIVSWSSYDGENYPGLAILFGYKTDSTLYHYYNIGRYILLIIIFFFTLYTGIMYYTVGSRQTYSGEEVKYWPLFKNGFISLLLIIIILFSTIIDGTLNKAVSMFSDTDLHDMIQGNKEF